MKPSCQVADKAVSTEDLERNLFKQGTEEDDDEEEKKKKKETASNAGNSTAIEVMRLEAVLAALVESKVVAIKAASSSKKSAIKNILRPRSQSTTHGLRQQRLTSTSTTASSSHKESNHQTHHHHRHRHCHKRQSDSVLFASGFFSKKHHRHNCNHNHNHRHHHHHHHHILAENEGDTNGRVHMKMDEEAGCRLLQQETAFGGSMIALSPPTAGPSSSYQNGSPTHQGGFHNYDRRREKHRIVTSACPSPTHSTQSKILVTRCKEADYIAINMERAEDEEEDTEYHLNGLMDTEDVGAGRASLQDAHRNPKRKRRRKKKADAEGRVRRGASGGGLDPEDLPKRARWTIIATACLLLLMSVLLVGVTLRMAPIIDEMVRKENEEMVNAISREEGNEYNNTAKGVTVGSSPMPLSL